ncbi:helicase-related protein [Geopseudomonas aromaticivorans]
MPNEGLSAKTLAILEKMKVDPARALVEWRPRAYHLVSPGIRAVMREGEPLSLVGHLAGSFKVGASLRQGELLVLEAPFRAVQSSGINRPVMLRRMIGGNAVYAADRICAELDKEFGERYLHVKGKPTFMLGAIEMGMDDVYAFPQGFERTWEALGKDRAIVVPVYPLTRGVTQQAARETMREVLQQFRGREVPASLLSPMNEFMLPSDMDEALHAAGRPALPLSAALVGLHGGYTMQLSMARTLVAGASAFHKSLLLPEAWRVLQNQPRYREEEVAPVVKIAARGADAVELTARWPFPPTRGQVSAVSEIAEHFHDGDTRARLLQGDVGAGKTQVIATSAALMLQCGYQVAVLAPTAVLADQLFKSIRREIEGMLGVDGPAVHRYSRSMSLPERRGIAALMKEKKPAVFVGTHALASQKFGKLGLMVFDEEQRFSSDVKGELKARYPEAHQLLVSATPIPRTLASTIYAGTRVTSLTDKPAARKPVKTAVIMDDDPAEVVLGAIRKILSRGQQVYVICPAVESSAMASVEAAAGWLKGALGSGVSVGEIHGAMSDDKADAALTAFKAGETKLIVGTTILAVGVDVPNANLMVVFDPHMMGISQLHQIRGRVGRGGDQGYCMLVPTVDLNERQKSGLDIIASTTDGFALAEYDLQVRGGGDFSGQDQSGHALDWAFLANEAQVMVNILESRREALTAQREHHICGLENRFD